MRKTINLFDEEAGDYAPVELPAKYEVCDCCGGKGTRCNLGAMTGSEYHEICHEDPDFPEDYKSGMYDVRCEECKGLRVVSVIDEDQLDERTRTRLHKHYDELAADAAQRRTELRYGY